MNTKNLFRKQIALLACAVLLSASLSTPAAAQGTTTITMYGALSNFDAVNDMQYEAHGFEIELDGISPNQILGTYPNRYGAPVKVPFAGGTYLRWVSAWDATTQQWAAATVSVTNPTATNGHACLPFLPNYNTSGCEHFGVSIYYVNPTKTVYHWLIADPQNPGTLIANGTAVSIPAPVWTAVPPAQPGAAPVVIAQIEAPKPPRPELQFGEAQWVKVFKTELPREVALDELVTDNPVVPQAPAQAEVSWKLIQHNPHSANSGVLRNQGGLNGGSRAVIRRYEFYKYTGAYDPLDHKALCNDPQCNVPTDAEVGNYIGAQMAAANVGVPGVTVAKVGNGSVSGAVNCGNTCSVQTGLGAVVTLNANPASNSVFTGWDGACNGNQATCSITVNETLNVTATFALQFNLSIGRGGSGTVIGTPDGNSGTAINCGNKCSAKFTQGATVTLTATPAAGQRFTGWGGACAGTAPTCNVVISKDTTVQANFAK